MANGKNKGNAFERKLAVDLSNWFSKGTNLDLFWRSMNSGGRATTRNKTDKKLKLHCGDIAAIDPAGEALLKVVTIEIKRGYSSSTIQDIFDNSSGKSKYKEWIEQAERAKEESGSFSWLLIHKRDRRDPVVLFPEKLYLEMGGMNCKIKAQFTFEGIKGEYDDNKSEIFVSTLEDFFNSVDPDKFRKIGQCES